MAEEVRPPGKTTIAPDVLLTIAHLTTLSVQGVSAMSPRPGVVNRLLRKGHQNNGVHIEIEGDRVDANLYVVLEKDAKIKQVSHTIQREVGRAISEMVGMEVGDINIHIEDFDFDSETS